MISIIVPVYQAEKTLSECIESILSQTMPDFELILVDDGSTDGSGDLCDSYAAKHDKIRVIHKENKGAAAARNTGVLEAAGEWICFIDSDDVIAPDFLEVLIHTADETGADIVSCAYVKCSREEARYGKALFDQKISAGSDTTEYRGKDGVRALLYQKGFISAPWGMISKRKLWNGVSFPEGSAAEDMGTIYRLFLEASSIARTDRVLYGYVVSASNTVFSTSSKRNPDYFRHSRQMISYIKKYHPGCLRAAASRHLSTCFQILSETDPESADASVKSLTGKIYADIKSVRPVVIKDPGARVRNRGAALLSCFSTGVVHRLLYNKYLRDFPRDKGNHIALAEYQGRCDEAGKAVGHAPKVLAEYVRMTEQDHKISIYAPACIVREIPDDIVSCSEIHHLRHEIIMKGHMPFIDRILNKFRMFLNIRHILHESDADVIWFFNVEFYLFLYLSIFGNAGKRIVVTMFIDGYHTGALAGIKQKIFERGQRRVSRCISTGPSFEYKNMPSVFIPDYVCDDSIYAKYRGNLKEACAVCLGTMDHGKELDELIEAFNRISYRLVIAGRFYDKSWFEDLKAKAADNIEIRDVYLDQEEYLSLLSHAVYAVLPYNERKYASQTSGVMQEAIFTDTIVLTHSDILTGNKVPGVGYRSYKDITDSLLGDDPNDKNGKRNRSILEKYKELRHSVYDKEKIKKKINYYSTT